MEIAPESACMALKCLVERSRSLADAEADGEAVRPVGIVKFAVVPGSVTVAELLRFVLLNLDLKVDPGDCLTQVLLPHWKALSLSDICAQPEATSAVSLLSQICNIATLKITLPAQEPSVLQSSVMRSLLRSLIPPHACSLAAQVAWFQQAGCPLSEPLIESFLAAPEDFEFSYRARRDFSDWHGRVCLQYLQQVSRSCHQLGTVAFTLAPPGLAVPILTATLEPAPQIRLPLESAEVVREVAAGEAAPPPSDEAATPASATGISALGRLTERFRSTASSRQRLKAARAAAAATTVAAAPSPAGPTVTPTDTEAAGEAAGDCAMADEAAGSRPEENNNNSNGAEEAKPLLLLTDFNEQGRPSAAGSPDTLIAGDKRRRTRVFIDPTTEIPQLERWFQQESHPTSAQFAAYARVLNAMPFRLKQPCLEAKNVQLWFKNHRAKVKRERLDAPAQDTAADAADRADAPDAPDASDAAGEGLALPLAPSPSNSACSADEAATPAAEVAEAEVAAGSDVELAQPSGSELLGVTKLQAFV